MILFRYLAREVYSATVAITGILVFVFLANQLIRWLSQAASGDLATNALLHLMALETPYLIGLLLPLGLFLGLLIAYGRLYADNEMTVLFAAGLSRWHLRRLTLALASVVFFIVAILMLWVNPIIAAQKNTILDDSSTSALLATIMPGRFQTAMNDRLIFYVDSLSHDHKEAQHIFVAEKPSEDNASKESDINTKGWVILTAKTGTEKADKHNRSLYIVARDGYRYTGVPGHNDYQVTKFDEYGFRVKHTATEMTDDDEEAIPTWMLLADDDNINANLAELEWRLSLPISVFLLALLAMQISRVKPRQGRFKQLVPAILIYIIYANLIFLARDWLAEGVVPTWLGMWWVHGVLLAVIGLMMLSQSWKLRLRR